MAFTPFFERPSGHPSRTDSTAMAASSQAVLRPGQPIFLIQNHPYFASARVA